MGLGFRFASSKHRSPSDSLPALLLLLMSPSSRGSGSLDGSRGRVADVPTMPSLERASEYRLSLSTFLTTRI